MRGQQMVTVVSFPLGALRSMGTSKSDLLLHVVDERGGIFEFKFAKTVLDPPTLKIAAP